ncbi:hypothetical protein VTN00DRAFT_1549 [Thermoascus crustaceus]|uniref:uncharacterized protein n=1 Tax=Thermoascus crustaceus TaxID=5088 RepID=UPI003743F931
MEGKVDKIKGKKEPSRRTTESQERVQFAFEGEEKEKHARTGRDEIRSDQTRRSRDQILKKYILVSVVMVKGKKQDKRMIRRDIMIRSQIGVLQTPPSIDITARTHTRVLPPMSTCFPAQRLKTIKAAEPCYFRTTETRQYVHLG